MGHQDGSTDEDPDKIRSGKFENYHYLLTTYFFYFPKNQLNWKTQSTKKSSLSNLSIKYDASKRMKITRILKGFLLQLSYFSENHSPI